MADLKFNTDAFDTAISSYTTVATEMTSIKQTMEKAMAELETSWQTPAGVKFRDLYDDNWAQHVDQYVLVLNKLVELLTNAKNDYQELEEEIPKIFN